MAKYINADALMDKMWQVCGEEDTEIEKGRVKWNSGLWLRYKVFEETISEIPAADVRPNVKGEWIDCSDDGYVECPICGSLTTCEDNKDELRYCWHCGAEMGGNENG